jgi:hypothetical protein
MMIWFYLRSNYAKVSALTAVLLLISVCIPSDDSVAGVPEKGSLIVTIPSREGLLVVADKLTTNPRYGKVDGARKILQADADTIVGTIGVISLLTLRAKPGGTQVTDTLFDATVSAQKFFRQNKVQGSIYQVGRQLATAIANDFMETVSKLPPEWMPPEQQDHFLFESVVCHYNRVSRHFEVMSTRFFFYKQPLSITLKAPPTTYDANALEQSKALWFGNWVIVNSLKTGHEFPEYDRDKLLDDVTGSVKPRDQFSLTMALRAASRLITMTSLKLPAGAPFPVGTHIDAAVVTPNGVQWLYDNVSTDYLDSSLAPLIRAAPAKAR